MRYQAAPRPVVRVVSVGDIELLSPEPRVPIWTAPLNDPQERTVRRQTSMAGLAVIAAVALCAYRRSRPRDYTRCSEFRAIVGDYVI